MQFASGMEILQPWSEATLNVWNLADKDYYSSCSSGFAAGERRIFLAGIRHRW
jgi:outer membrane receptor protein involved in Fe transport